MFHVKQFETQFNQYTALLLRENAKYNLTSIIEPLEIAQKHYADSLAILNDAPSSLPSGACLLDVGSGAGFPGVPLAIARPDLRVTLLDSTAKKVRFLTLLCETLSLSAEVHCARAEQAAHAPALREHFDVVTSRAVAALPLLCELCLPFVRPGGVFVAYKGMCARTQEELQAAAPAIALLGGAVQRVAEEETPYGERTRVYIAKAAATPAQYPRGSAAIAKRPL